MKRTMWINHVTEVDLLLILARNCQHAISSKFDLKVEMYIGPHGVMLSLARWPTDVSVAFCRRLKKYDMDAPMEPLED